MISTPTRLPFDLYQRYRVVADVLSSVHGGASGISVLDVGGRTAVLRDFVSKERVTLVDLEPANVTGFVLGDGAKLPFRDKSFDVVTALDTLEHVPPAARTAFLRECGRVARRWVVIAGPYHSERVAKAETLLRRFLKQKLGIEHRYLDEHRRYGLPSREATERELAEMGARVRSLGHANLDRWLAMMCLSMYLDDDPSLRSLGASVNEFYNRNLYASDHGDPVYRHIVIGAFDGAPLPDAHALQHEQSAPRGALRSFGELAGELVAFDRERTAWREERGKLAQVTNDLSMDLESHRKTLEEIDVDLISERAETSHLRDALAECRAEQQHLLEELASERLESADAIESLSTDLGQHRGTVEELRADLGLHRETVAELRSDLEGVRGELEHRGAQLGRERAEAARSIATLEQDLASHRAAHRELTGELEKRRRGAGEIEAELRSELDEHKCVLADVTAELESHRKELASLRAMREQERKEVEALREGYESELGRHRSLQTELEARLGLEHDGALAIQQELLRANESAAAAASKLLEQEQSIAELNALLRSRKQNLVRVFGRKQQRYGTR
ncbi:MAG TPA: methyltransferase domain-containing protein [Planctomycetota bacterium]|nr:methyltransferase domain-containing protein [Planctomycetota bacterium]